MPRGQKFTAERIIGKLRETHVELARGKAVPDVVRRLGMTEQTNCRWKREYGGLRTDLAKRLKNLARSASLSGNSSGPPPGHARGRTHGNPSGGREFRRFVPLHAVTCRSVLHAVLH